MSRSRMVVITAFVLALGTISGTLAGSLVIDANSTIVTVAPAPVPQTGQRVSYRATDDGATQIGIEWDAATRFTDNGDGTVTDNLTGLIWLQDATCMGGIHGGYAVTWEEALTDTAGLEDPVCDLRDGSVAGDWRLPNVREMLSLIDYGRSDPPLPAGHPFTYYGGIGAARFWTSTTRVYGQASQDMAWYVHMLDGDASVLEKTTNTCPVWPVRGEGITAFYQYLPLAAEGGS